MISQFIDIIIHIDQHLSLWVQDFGSWTYVIIFLIIFAETGLVIFPFLPGDSFLFALGAICSLTPVLDPFVLFFLLLLAAFIGDNLNYFFGQKIGARWALEKGLIKQHQLEKTQSFYQKYGSKAVIMARFVPIVRTISPFVAGVGSMNYKNFMLNSLIASLLWVGIFLPAGYFLGQHPAVKNNFHIVIFAIIFISILPMLISYVQHRRKN